MIRRCFFVLILLLSISKLFDVSIALAHPGNTAADGCHYCRTNCDDWGEAWDERHCHGGSSSYSPTPVYTKPVYTTPSCPTNSNYEYGSCTCNTGYAPSINGSSCIKIPSHASRAFNGTDVWLCEEGYQEAGNSCIKKEIPVEPVVSSSIETDNAEEENLEESEEQKILTEKEISALLTKAQKKDKFTDGEILSILLVGGGILYWLNSGKS